MVLDNKHTDTEQRLTTIEQEIKLMCKAGSLNVGSLNQLFERIKEMESRLAAVETNVLNLIIDPQGMKQAYTDVTAMFKMLGLDDPTKQEPDTQEPDDMTGA